MLLCLGHGGLNQIVLNLGLGLHAPELEVVVAAKTAVASLPLCVKDVWFEVREREREQPARTRSGRGLRVVVLST